MTLLKKQHAISAFLPMPVEASDQATTTTTVAGEAITFVVAATGVNDAGSAAGTLIYARTSKNRIQDTTLTRIGSAISSSFAFVTGTALTTMVEFPLSFWENWESLGGTNGQAGVGPLNIADRISRLGTKFLPTNGQFVVDHVTGLIIGRKATTATSDTAGYTYRSLAISATIGASVNANLFDAAGNPITSTGGALDVSFSFPSPSLFTNFGANATLNVKPSAGVVYSFSCHNTNLATRYLQLHNTATVPGGGAIPLITIAVLSGSTSVIGTDFFGQGGVAFSTGIAFAFSTTEMTYTAGSAADQVTQITYA